MIIMTEYAGSNFSGKILCRSFRELVVFVLMMSVLLLVSWWSLTCVSVVVGVLAAIWRCVRQSRRCSVMFRVLLMFSWCFGGVEETAFFEPKWLTCQYQIGVNRDATLCYCYCGRMLG
jgi:hypothetical protein